MNLDEYLEAIEKCPDEFITIKDKLENESKLHRLTFDLGIYDNFTILMKTDYYKIIRYFEGSNYTLEGIKQNGNYHMFAYNPGTVELRIFNSFCDGYATIPLRDDELVDTEKQRHFQKQKKDFNISILLNPYQNQEIKNVSWQKAITFVIKDIAEYAKREKSSLCFPKSIVWNDENNCSKIIYYYPD